MAHAKGIFGDIPHEVISTVTRDNEHSEEAKERAGFTIRRPSESELSSTRRHVRPRARGRKQPRRALIRAVCGSRIRNGWQRRRGASRNALRPCGRKKLKRLKQKEPND